MTEPTDRIAELERHLFLGTHRENMLDMCRKGRHNKPKGEDSWRSKLRVEQVKEIRRLYELGSTQRQLANQFGVRKSTVYAVVNRVSWSHV